jgi:hypothetical protein
VSIQRTLIPVALLACWLLVFSTSLSASDDQGLACFEELVLPKYPLLARQARIEGDVILRVWVDQPGRLTSSVNPEGPTLLKPAVERVLNTAKFSKACVGKDSRLVFSFQLDPSAEPQNFDNGTIIIRWPDRIILRAAPFPMSGSTATVTRQMGQLSARQKDREGIAEQFSLDSLDFGGRTSTTNLQTRPRQVDE